MEYLPYNEKLNRPRLFSLPRRLVTAKRGNKGLYHKYLGKVA